MKTALIPFCWKIHVMCTTEKLNGSTSLENNIMCYVSFKIKEQENVYLGVVKFKTEDQKFLGRLLIFTLIPLTPKKCGLSIGYKGRIRE